MNSRSLHWALSQDGNRLATAAEDGTVRVWSVEPFQQLAGIPRQESLVTSLTFTGEGHLLMTRLDGTFQVFRISEEAPESISIGMARRDASAFDVSPKELNEVAEVENNDSVETAQAISLPASVRGAIYRNEVVDVDCFRFHADAGQSVVLETFAASEKSPLDSVIEILDLDGAPVLRTRLQAVRDSWLTFRGKDSNTSDDFVSSTGRKWNSRFPVLRR